MARIDELQDWLGGNQAIKDSPEYIKNRDEYRALKEQEQVQFREQQSSGPNAVQRTMQESPGGVTSTAARIGTGAALGLGDLATGVGNAAITEAKKRGVNWWGAGVPSDYTPQTQPMPSDWANKQLGVPDAPAGTTRALLEGSAQALLGGGGKSVINAIQNAPSWLRAAIPALFTTAKTAVAPTAASMGAGTLGEKYAESIGLDPSTGALLGSLAGGVVAGAAPGAVDNLRHASYARNANPNAQNLVSDARMMMANTDLANAPPGTYGPPEARPIGELPLNAGMLGNDKIRIREQALGGAPGAREYINERRQAPIDMINEALNRITTQRGATEQTPTRASVGQDVRDITGDTAVGLRERSAQQQQELRDRIGGDDTMVNVERIFESAQPHLDQNVTQLTPLARDAISSRLDLLRRSLQLDPETRNPLEPPQVRLGPFSGWRTELGRAIDAAVPGGKIAAAPQLYGPATDVYRNTAAYQGVPPVEFENVMGFNRDIMRPPDVNVPGDRGGPYEQQMAIANKEPQAAYSWLKGGNANPERFQFLEETQHPGLPGVMGDYLRMIQQNTIGRPSSQGPAQFAREVSEPRMAPESLQSIAGPHTPEVQAAARVADASVYPTNQMRLGRAAGSGGEAVANVITNTQIGNLLGKMLEGVTGIPHLAEAGSVAGSASRIPLALTRAKMLEGPLAINAMGGGAAPPVMTIPELAASLTAAGTSLQGPRAQ